MSRTTSSFLQPSPRFQAPNNYKVDSDLNFLKSSKEFQQGGSDFYQAPTNQQQQTGGGLGLARYRSAPSSFLAALLDSGATDNSSSGDESEAMFSAFMNNSTNNNNNNNNPKSHNNSTTVNHHDGSSHPFQMKRETGAEPETQTRPEFRNGAMGYECAVNGGGGAIVGSYSVGMESHVNGNGSGLMRQSSSPAGFFNGFGVMGDVGSYTVHNHSKANSSASGMSNHISFSSGPASGSRFMPTIPENGNDSIGTRSDPEREAAFQHSSWNGSSFNSVKRNRDGELKMFSSFGALDNQNTETRKNSSGLVHHLSLPKSFESEKLLHFQQETVPCQIRAKRGCATHPRSIAERNRRTRISERMKKLQDLFPNMDKQTNTADMLDLAVEYIKDLQKQVQTLKDTRAKCVCPNRSQHSNTST